MKMLRTLFEGIEYDEVSGAFDGLEQTFSALVEPINLELLEIITENDVMTILKKNADEWDEIIRQSQEVENYITQTQGIYRQINSYWLKLLQADKVDIYDATELVQKWFNEMHRPDSFSCLLFIHQRMRQLRHLVELFQRRTDKKKVTNRHLFERGFALLDTDGIRYLERMPEGQVSGISLN